MKNELTVNVSVVMVRAALKVLHESGVSDHESLVTPLLARKVLETALAARAKRKKSFLKKC